MEFIVDKVFEQKDFVENGLSLGEYEACTFSNCNFANSVLSKLKFIACTFSECDLFCIKALFKTHNLRLAKC